jgi:hypothetical protein
MMFSIESSLNSEPNADSCCNKNSSIGADFNIGDAKVYKKVKCAHCEALFEPTRRGHLHCSDTCRKLRNKAKNKVISDKKRKRRLEQKVKKLASSTFGRYLVREIKRAKTAQILTGHSAASLKALVALRRRCTIASGYKEGEPLGTYELSHIWPVNPKAFKAFTLDALALFADLAPEEAPEVASK